jgi:hypothetical protein
LVSRSKGIGSTIIVVAVVIVLIVATIAFVTLSKSSTSTNPSTSSASSSNTTSTPGTASTSNSSDGLEFSLQTIPSGNGTFTIAAEEVNHLSSVNNITEANQWKYSASLLDPFNNCAPGDSPVGFAVFQGYYGMNNYTSGEALPLYNTATLFSCTVNYFPNVYLFQPKSDNISVYNDRQFRVNTTASVSASVSGYWTGGQGLTSPATFNGFAGSYTVLGADEWGNVLLLHFSVTTSSSSSSTANGGLPAECRGAPSFTSGLGEVVASTSSPAVLCFQLYYYSATPLTLNLTSALSIQALQYVYNGSVGAPRSFSGAPNFTVSASKSQLVIGGPTNENEGAVIVYNLTARAGASGTYQLGFLPSSSLTTWMVGAQEPEQCGYYAGLVAGDGLPNYEQITHCITYSYATTSSTTTCLCPTAPAACPCASESTSSSPSISGVPYPLIGGDIYFRIVGETSSAG